MAEKFSETIAGKNSGEIIFLSDLDRTLIFSYNRLSSENLCVEKREGKELSYMTHRSAGIFSEIVDKITFIPITTRSKEQYERIVFPGGYVPRYAIIDNGANLLVDGVPDSEWRKEFREAFLRAADEITACREFLQKEKSLYYKITVVDDSFLFTKSREPAETLERICRNVRIAHTSVYQNGEKLYVIPTGISKERAADKIREMLSGDILIAAGDSFFDEQMLRRADIAIIKSGELSGRKLNPKQFSENSGDDPDFVMNTLAGIVSKKDADN